MFSFQSGFFIDVSRHFYSANTIFGEVKLPQKRLPKDGIYGTKVCNHNKYDY